MIYELSFRSNSGAVIPGQLRAIGSTDYIAPRDMALLNHDEITFLVHGFNVEEQPGRTSLASLASSLHAANGGTYVFVLWPGDSPIGPLSYPLTEGHQANDTAVELLRIIESHTAPTTKLNFIAHSLGCRVVLETLRNLSSATQGKHDHYPVNQVCLMAAAVDDYCLSMPDAYRAAVEKARRIVVLSSVEDEVLKYIYPLGDLIQSFIFFWKETFGLALGYHGPKNYASVQDTFDEDEIQVWPIPGNVQSIAIDAKINVNHGDYLPSDDANSEQRKKQKSAEKIAREVISGEDKLQYIISG